MSATWSTYEGRTRRVFDLRGYSISEVDFFLDEQGWVMGYMVGPDDGKTGLDVTPEQAIESHRERLFGIPCPHGPAAWRAQSDGVLAR